MKFTFAIIALSIAVSSQAQRVKYRDLFPTLALMGNQELKNSLKEFLVEERDHPNANFRLALAYEKSYKTADPLTNYEYVLANAEQAKLRYIKAKQLVDDREVSRNNEYYFAIFKTFDAKGKPDVPFDMVSKKINSGYDSAELYARRIPYVYKSFTKSVNFYDKAVKIFADVNSRFLSLDDLYLYFDGDLDRQLGDLEASYDSAKFYLDQYLMLIKNYPIPFHKQKYVVNQIVTYRLDGLVTKLNFLNDKIELWDYEKWVGQVRSSVHTSISSMRNNLNQTEEKLDNALTQIDQLTPGIVPVKLDKQLVFNLNNFDKQSLALALLEYKTFKQGWLNHAKFFTPDTIFSDRNADAYSSMIYSNRNADTLCNTANARLTPDKIGKHKDFFLKYYGNNEGLHRYLTTEKEFITKTYKEYATQLRAQVIGLAARAQAAEAAKLLRFGKWNISTQAVTATKELIQKGEPITLQSRKSPDGSIYLAGSYKMDKKSKFVSAFLAKINPDGKPGWIKNFEYKKDSLSKTMDAHNSLTAVELTKDGCVAMIRTNDTIGYYLNTFVYFNDKGEQKFKIKLKENSFPRKLTYVEKTNSFVVVLKGVEEKDNYTSSESLNVMNLNALGEVQWTRAIELTGTFTDLVNLTNGNMVVGNFMILKGMNGKEYRTQVPVKESNPFAVLFSDKGDVLKIQPIQSSRSAYIFRAVKINDSSINLIGSEGTFETQGNSTFVPGENSIHFMIDRYGQKICSNL